LVKEITDPLVGITKLTAVALIKVKHHPFVA